MFWSLSHFCGLSLASLQSVHIFVVLRSTERDTALQVWTHQCRAEWKGQPLDLLAVLCLLCAPAAQDTIGLFCCKGTLLTQIQLGICQDHQVLSMLLSSKVTLSMHWHLGLLLSK